jgi:hypothetical protein
MHFIHWILMWLPLIGMAAGSAVLPVADAGDAGGADGDAAASGDDAGGDSDDGSGDGSGADPDAAAGAGGDDRAVGQLDPNVPLYKHAKAVLEEIKAKNPALAKQIQTALIRQDKTDRALPIGFEKASNIIKDLEQLAYPGTEGRAVEQVVTDLRSEVQGWRAFDAKISKGDPSVIDELVTAAPEALQTLVPAALAKFSEINPDGYSALVTQAVMSDATQAEIPLQLTMLRTFIPRLPDSPEKQEIVSAYNALAAWFERLKGFASKPVTAKAAPGSAKDGKDAEAVQAARELDLTRREYNSRSASYGIKLATSEISRIAGATKITDDQKQKIMAKVNEEVGARLEAISAPGKDYGDAMRGYLANRNEEGYRRRLHSEYHKLIPGAVRRAIDDLEIKVTPKAGVKPGTAAPVKKPVAGAKPAAAAPAGFEKISGHPRTISGMPAIDLLMTTQGMLMKHTAILKGGRKVRW